MLYCDGNKKYMHVFSFSILYMHFILLCIVNNLPGFYLEIIFGGVKLTFNHVVLLRTLLIFDRYKQKE